MFWLLQSKIKMDISMQVTQLLCSTQTVNITDNQLNHRLASFRLPTCSFIPCSIGHSPTGPTCPFSLPHTHTITHTPSYLTFRFILKQLHHSFLSFFSSFFLTTAVVFSTCIFCFTHSLICISLQQGVLLLFCVLRYML